MLLYANINGAGFYAMKNDKRMVRVFYIVTVLSIVTIFLLSGTVV
jgi:hypothetical protein